MMYCYRQLQLRRGAGTAVQVLARWNWRQRYLWWKRRSD